MKLQHINEAGDPFDKAVNQIAKATDQNDHNGAMLMLAKMLGNKKLEKVMKGLEMIQDNLGSMPSELLRYRDNTLQKDMLKQAEKKFGKDKADMIHGAF